MLGRGAPLHVFEWGREFEVELVDLDVELLPAASEADHGVFGRGGGVGEIASGTQPGCFGADLPPVLRIPTMRREESSSERRTDASSTST